MKFEYYKNWGFMGKSMGKLLNILSKKKVCLIFLIILILLFFCVPTMSSQEIQIIDYDEFYREVFTNWELLDILEVSEGVVKKDVVYEILDGIVIISSKTYNTITLYYYYKEGTRYTFYEDVTISSLIGSLETIEELKNAIDFDKLYSFLDF